MHSRALALLALVALVAADMYDVIQPHLAPPAGGCIAWADASDEINSYWAAGAPPASAGSFCAQQGKGSANKTCGSQSGMTRTGFCEHSYCVSKLTNQIALCTSTPGVPEQVNVQIAGPDAVVMQFVTFEAVAPSKPPTVSFGTASGAPNATVEGATHAHVTAGKRTYYMHFVRLEGLAPRARYYYTVHSGGAGASPSGEFTFRAPYGGGETRIDLYGDMGVYTWNNMANLEKDAITDESADLIIHAGDHCYNEGDDDEARADGYMQAFEQTIANVPWMPIVGNHEFYSGTQLSRYLDSTFEKWAPIDTDGESDAAYGAGVSTATSALGAFLSAGNHHAAGTTVSPLSNSVPSNSSRYFSVDFGLTHLVALSLNGYNGVDTCTDECNAAQVAWLKEDLAAVDRAKTPWVIAMSHFPMYLSAALEGEGEAAPQYTGVEPWNVAEECEFPAADGFSHSQACKPKNWTAPTANATLSDAIADLEPVFDQFGVDIYWAGHIHFYETFDGPIRGGKVVSKGTINPKATVHVCTGNGGPPSASPCVVYCGVFKKNCKKCIANPYSYSRLTVHNATDLTWTQVSNKDNSIIDEWVMHQDRHGPFLG